jgi:hypothetical protein
MTVRSYAFLALLPATLLIAIAATHYFERPPAADPAHIPDRDINYSQISPTLYLGGRVTAPPPGTAAVLNLSYTEDLYKAAFHQTSSIPDGQPVPSLDWLKEQIRFIEEQQDANRITYIHCDAGVSRSATVTTAWLMYKNHWTRDQALAFLKQKRPSIQPNAHFLDLLLAWERELTQ